MKHSRIIPLIIKPDKGACLHTKSLGQICAMRHWIRSATEDRLTIVSYMATTMVGMVFIMMGLLGGSL
jgi:hypothetical protein